MKPHNIPMALRNAYLSMHRQTNYYLSKYGITADQFVCLAVLNEEDGITQQELSIRANSDPNTMRAMLILLEKQNLIIRKKNNNDKRANLVYLTKNGIEIYKMLFKESEPIRKKIASALSLNETNEIEQLLTKIIQAMN